jgi:ATP-dependent RNA helicase DeaD
LNKFQELGLSAPVVNVLSALGIENPTQIQQEAIPKLLQSKCDFIGLAQTGTGKTAAFGLPLVDLIDSTKQETQALVIVPTRELGQQVAQQLMNFAKGTKGIFVQVVYGGKPIMHQIKALKRAPQILVATPGRLIDLINRKAVNLDTVERIVLDEADEMLNMGFQEDIDKILSYTQTKRNIWLFSATMPAEIRKIVATYMSSPQEVSVKPHEKINVDIEHQYLGVKSGSKNDALSALLISEKDARAVVFCRTRRDTDEVATMLRRAGVSSEPIHGDLSQGQRDKAMRLFKTNKVQVLVATDVAARGIDVSDITHVIHYALPDDLSFYTHRSGRTARAGKKGISIAIISRGDIGRIQQIEGKLGVTFAPSPFYLENVSEPMDMTKKMQVRERNTGRGGRSGGGRSSGFNSGFGRPANKRSEETPRFSNDRRESSPKSSFSGDRRESDSNSSFSSDRRESSPKSSFSSDRRENSSKSSFSDNRNKDNNAPGRGRNSSGVKSAFGKSGADKSKRKRISKFAD